VDWLARAGLTARGIIYALIGILAIEIAFGNSGHKADQSGAVRLVASTPLGALLLWLLVGGFIGMALRAFTKTPAGPWLLVLVALGLVLFGIYSIAEARWRRV
jgi:hypothetical protein